MRTIWTYDTLMNGMIERCGIWDEFIYPRAFLCIGRNQLMYLSSSECLRDSCIGIDWFALLDNPNYCYMSMLFGILILDFQNSCWVGTKIGEVSRIRVRKWSCKTSAGSREVLLLPGHRTSLGRTEAKPQRCNYTYSQTHSQYHLCQVVCAIERGRRDLQRSLGEILAALSQPKSKLNTRSIVNKHPFYLQHLIQ